MGSNESSHSRLPISSIHLSGSCPEALLREGEGIQALSLLEQQQPGSIGRKQLLSNCDLETQCQLNISHSMVSEEVEETETTELTNYFHSQKQIVKRDLRSGLLNKVKI